MSDQKPISIFVDRAVTVALRNNTIRMTFGLERSQEEVDERIEIIMPISTCATTLESLLSAVRGLRETATGSKPGPQTGSEIVKRPTTEEPRP